jgi:hypothetical protein
VAIPGRPVCPVGGGGGDPFMWDIIILNEMWTQDCIYW